MRQIRDDTVFQSVPSRDMLIAWRKQVDPIIGGEIFVHGF